MPVFSNPEAEGLGRAGIPAILLGGDRVAGNSAPGTLHESGTGSGFSGFGPIETGFGKMTGPGLCPDVTYTRTWIDTQTVVIISDNGELYTETISKGCSQVITERYEPVWFGIGGSNFFTCRLTSTEATEPDCGEERSGSTHGFG